MNLAEWVGAAGELLIALVIFWEMEEGRRDRFLFEAANTNSYENRGKIYSDFFDTAAESLAEKAERFCERIWTEGKDDDACLKKCCEHQIVLFNRLGQIRRRAWWFYRNDYVELFPHAVVLFWIMIEPYVKDRRAMTGEWWARDFEQLTKECLRFILQSRPNATLYLYDRDRKKKNDLEIPNSELRALQDRLENRQLRG